MIYQQGPQAGNERPTAGHASSGRSPRAPDVRFDQRSGMRTATASVHTLHSFGRNGDDQVRNRRPSIAGRIFRTLTRFVVTLLIGIGGTLAWQSYGDVAREMVAARSPALAWWLPPTRWSASASSNPAQQAAPVASLDTVRRSVEQLAARQDQMAQSLAALLAIEVDIRQKMAFTPASAAPIPALSQPAAVPAQPPKPAQPRPRSLVAQ
jgi:hypothetical protein